MAPLPDYFHEALNGTLWRDAAQIGLSTPQTAVPPTAEVLREGQFILRYGIEMLRSPHALVPGLFISEQGGAKSGRQAWDWLWTKFQLYPRAEVIGLRSDGNDEHLYVRDLDFGMPVRVLVYASVEDVRPLGHVAVLHAPTGAPLPDFVARYLG
ncbi:MAG: hypothetical protein HC915_04900 [Anaerolineae bacterium]|nr:hypothetical protein [Anaerolineae bacterium]